MTVCGEKVTGVCVVGKCPHFKRCCPVVWDKYGKIKPKTNENWFCSLPTEEKAKVLETIIIKYLLMKQPKCYEITKREFWELWLKEIHNNG